MDPTKILLKDEVVAVVNDLRGEKGRRIARSKNMHRNLILFRLSCCCGLRRVEIAGLNVGDVSTAPPRPAIRVRATATKRTRLRGGKKVGRARVVPLWWDSGTWQDIAAWKQIRIEEGATTNDPFLPASTLQHGTPNRRLSMRALNHRWKTAIKVLGAERIEHLGIHTGRRTFCSLSLAAGRSLVEVRDAAGHANIAMTSQYLYAVSNDDIPDVFS